MYQLVLDKEQHRQFKYEAKMKLLEKDMSIKELAKEIGYPESSVYNFFANQNSKFIAYSIAKYLGMEIKKYE